VEQAFQNAMETYIAPKVSEAVLSVSEAVREQVALLAKELGRANSEFHKSIKRELSYNQEEALREIVRQELSQ
jgi:hypothetical protein